MRSTVRIDDDLMIELRARAHAESVSLTHMLNRTLRAGLARSELGVPPTGQFGQETAAMGRPTTGLEKAPALAARLEDAPAGEPTWTSQPMCARVDLDDKEAVRALLDGEGA